LSLWRRIGIPDRPNLNFIIDWLKSLNDSEPLSEADLWRVKALLARHGTLIFEATSRALNLLGEWVPSQSIKYSLLSETSVTYSHLYASIKKETADLRDLKQSEVAGSITLAWSPLSAVIENSISLPPGITGARGQSPLWMSCIGQHLTRIIVEPETRQEDIRRLGKDLSLTSVFNVPKLKSVPYIRGMPAGFPKILDLLWRDQFLYIDSSNKARLAKLIPRELSRRFQNQDIAEALNYCYERPEHDICAYMETNFNLAPADSLVPISNSIEGNADIQSVDSGQASTLPESSPNTDVYADTTSSVPIPGYGPGDPEVEDGLENPVEVAESIQKVSASRTERKVRPPLIDRFASTRGFRHESEHRYQHPDGSFIEKSRNSIFPWEYRKTGGGLVRYFFPKDQCLELEPLEIPSEVWGLIEQDPLLHTLILVSPENLPVEVTGSELLDLRETKHLNLFPASYRLVKSDVSN